MAAGGACMTATFSCLEAGNPVEPGNPLPTVILYLPTLSDFCGRFADLLTRLLP